MRAKSVLILVSILVGICGGVLWCDWDRVAYRTRSNKIPPYLQPMLPGHTRIIMEKRSALFPGPELKFFIKD